MKCVFFQESQWFCCRQRFWHIAQLSLHSSIYYYYSPVTKRVLIARLEAWNGCDVWLVIRDHAVHFHCHPAATSQYVFFLRTEWAQELLCEYMVAISPMRLVNVLCSSSQENAPLLYESPSAAIPSFSPKCVHVTKDPAGLGLYTKNSSSVNYIRAKVWKSKN